MHWIWCYAAIWSTVYPSHIITHKADKSFLPVTPHEASNPFPRRYYIPSWLYLVCGYTIFKRYDAITWQQLGWQVSLKLLVVLIQDDYGRQNGSFTGMSMDYFSSRKLYEIIHDVRGYELGLASWQRMFRDTGLFSTVTFHCSFMQPRCRSCIWTTYRLSMIITTVSLQIT